MNLKEWSEYSATKILKWDHSVYREAFRLVCAKLAKEAGTSPEEVERAWVIRASEHLVATLPPVP
jgi:hypothetical protein